MKLKNLLFAAVMVCSSAGYASANGWDGIEEVAPEIFKGTPNKNAFCKSVSGLNGTTGMSPIQSVFITALCGTETGAQPTYVTMARERANVKDVFGRTMTQALGLDFGANKRNLVPALCTALKQASLSHARTFERMIRC